MSNTITVRKPVSLLVALFLSAAALLAGCGEDLEHASTDELMQKGRTAFEEKEYKKALKYFTPAAERGNAEAQYHVGLQLLYGADNIKRTGNINDVMRELNEMKTRGAEWLRKSAEQGYAPAQYSLAGCYLNGTGMERDAAKGVDWLLTGGNHEDFEEMDWSNDPYDLTAAIERMTDEIENGNDREKAKGPTKEDLDDFKKTPGKIEEAVKAGMTGIRIYLDGEQISAIVSQYQGAGVYAEVNP